MDKITELDYTYEQFIKHLRDHIPEGVQEVDLNFLNRLNLLHEQDAQSAARFTRFFHVVETKEKVTLFNDRFVVWIVPDRAHEEAATLVLLGLASSPQKAEGQLAIRLETAFSTTGVYNTSRIVLRVVERLLADIQENEEVISRLEEPTP